MIIDTVLDGLDILFGPALSFCTFFAPSLRAHEIILLLGFPKFVKPNFWYQVPVLCRARSDSRSSLFL